MTPVKSNGAISSAAACTSPSRLRTRSLSKRSSVWVCFWPSSKCRRRPIQHRGKQMAQGKDGTILIIEDDEGVARLQQRRLERAGYHALCTGNAEEAMEKIKLGGVELV